MLKDLERLIEDLVDHEVNVEIDDDLMQNAIAPDALVWIAATVDKDGNITSLDATEIQLLPANSNN